MKNKRKLPQEVLDLQKYLDTHFTERITLDQLSVQFSYNKFYLHKAFKSHVGMTPNEYLGMARIERAKQLLRTTDLTVAGIAQEIGLSNAGYFTNLFKKLEGITPSQWRKQSKPEQENPMP